MFVICWGHAGLKEVVAVMLDLQTVKMCELVGGALRSGNVLLFNSHQFLNDRSFFYNVYANGTHSRNIRFHIIL